MKKRTTLKLALAAALLLGAVLRFWGLGSHPAGLFRDEAEKGYNAWGLATTGRVLEIDPGRGARSALETKAFPWMINVMGNRTSALYHYAAAPWVGVGGLTVANTRRAAALFGTLALLAVSWVAWRAWGPAAGLACTAWLALMPWLIVFSRWAQQASAVPLLMALCLAGCIGIDHRRNWGWPLLGAGLGWLFYAYSGAQPFALAWGALLIGRYARGIAWRSEGKWVALGLVLLAVPVIPTAAVLLTPQGGMRLGQVAIWSDGASAGQVAGSFLINYAAHFDPRFLFLNGDPQPRHNYGGQGLLLILDLALIPLGLVRLFGSRAPLRWPLLSAVLLGPVGAAITREAPHALRSLPMAVPLGMIASVGWLELITWLGARLATRPENVRRSRIYQVCFALVALALGINGFARYWRAAESEGEQALAFQQTMRESWERIRTERRPGERIFMNASFPYAPYFALFYLQPTPEAVRSQSLETAMGLRLYPPGSALDRLGIQKGDWILEVGFSEPVNGPKGLRRARIEAIGEPETWLEHVGSTH